MSSNDALYTRLFTKLREFHSDEHLRRIKNWAWIVVGLIQSHSVHLSEIAQHIPSEAEAQDVLPKCGAGSPINLSRSQISIVR